MYVKNIHKISLHPSMSLNQKKREDKPWLVLKLSGILTTGTQKDKRNVKIKASENKDKEREKKRKNVQLKRRNRFWHFSNSLK